MFTGFVFEKIVRFDYKELRMPFGSEIPMKHAGRYMEQFVKVVVPKGTQGNSNNALAMAGIGGYNNGGTLWKSSANHGTSNSSTNSTPWSTTSNKK